MCGKNTDLMCVIIFLFLIRPLVTPGIDTINEGVQKVFGTLDLFVSLLETEIKYPILQGGILPFGHPHLLFSFNTYSRKQATVPVCLSGLRWLLR